MIVKICRECKQWFESKPMSYVNYCPKCFTGSKKEYLANVIKHKRTVNMDEFDIWDTNYPLEGTKYPYERVCRTCGNRILKKDGTHTFHKRYCRTKKCNGNDLWRRYSVHLMRKRGESYLCEECGRSEYEKKGGYVIFEIHHIIPVHTLTWDNLYLIWDRSNLRLLCPDCHHKQDHHLKRKIYEKKYRKLESWM